MTAVAPAKPRLRATHARKATGGSDTWRTPEAVLERVRRIAPIDLDPCTSKANPVLARHWLTEREDGLVGSWASAVRPGSLVYVNPPYSSAAAWATKVAEEARENALEIVSLVAARPDSRWFYRLVWDTAQAVCFWRGRLRFVGATSSAPFPSAVVYHGERLWAFEAAFHDAGRVLRL